VQGAGNTNETLTLGTVVDGQSSFAFTHTPASLPTIPANTLPDHIVDLQIKVVDLAGNFGFSDSDPATASVGAPLDLAQANTVRIDQKPPTFKTNTGACSPITSSPLPGVVCENATGKVFDAITKLDSATATSRKSVKVSFDGNLASSSVEASDFDLLFASGSTQAVVSVTVNGAVVYLSLGADLPPDQKPTVRLIGAVLDEAGNPAALIPVGTVATADGVPPAVSFVLSGGTGTGAAGGSEDSSKLTKDKIIMTVTLDEAAQQPPTVGVYTPDGADAGTDPDVEVAEAPGLVTVATTGNNFTLSYTAGAGLPGEKRFVVSAKDVAGNPGKSGSSTTKSYTNDPAFTLPVKSPIGGAGTGSVTVTSEKVDGTTGNISTSVKRPFVTLDFGKAGELSSVTIEEITLDGTNVTTQLVASSGKLYFLVPAADLSAAEHTVAIAAGKAKDAAANLSAAFSFKFTVVSRTTFDLSIFSGWNAVSFPSDPLVAEIDTVFGNAAITQVLAYDSLDMANPWRIATKDAASGKFTSTGEKPLNTVRSGAAYWVFSTTFVTAKNELRGPEGTGAGAPPPFVSIPVASGWNFVGVVDPLRLSTEGAAGAGLTRDPDGDGIQNAVTVGSYLLGPSETRVYRYDPTALSYVELGSGVQVRTGWGLWVHIVPNTDGTVPSITP
jgi:hypothetical protein